ncbi:FMN-binding negative transcriptional regulator [Aliiroseovarius sp. 2305UL8-7]|uniref:FMN-binding negative transcriptional regulator n=1 Tax=Aliiroseovarius conchicola TaxID=3121637 RepID=UPI0035275989
MHPNPTFREATLDQNIAFARDRAFGTLAINASDGPLISHVPFILSADGRTAELHLVRSNPIVRALQAPLAAVIAVTGADGYVSPDWYNSDDMVPTWNYVSVHIRGVLQLADPDTLLDLLTRQSAAYEQRLSDKLPWTMDKLSDAQTAKLTRMILPCRLDVDQIDGTWKLGQNREDTARLSAANKMPSGIGQELQEIARLMADPPA